MKNLVLLTIGLVVATAVSPVQAQNTPQSQPDKPFFFRDGDRAMILGDSITEQRQYSTLIESYTLSRFPLWNITFRNTGWSGDRANFVQRAGQENGLRRDIYPLKPTAVTIDFGMNDARSGEAGRQTYIDTSRSLTTALQNAGARVALVTSSPEEKYEAGQPAGSAYNTMLRSYSEGLKSVAAENNALFVDQLNPMIDTIELGRRTGKLGNAPGGARFIPDGVHGNWAGHMVMATHILKGLNAPGLVSSVDIHGATRKVMGAENAEIVMFPTDASSLSKIGADSVNDWRRDKGIIAFRRADKSLPWPLHPDTRIALDIPGFTPVDDLSRYTLKVTNLKLPRYEIAIDDKPIGFFTKEQLRAGINLSQNAGPISAQGQELLNKIIEKNNVFYERWRRVQIAVIPQWVGDIEPLRSAEIARLDARIAALEAEINVLRQPKTHVWTIRPIA